MGSAIVFFDGLCNLCNSSVQLMIKHDRDNYYKFSSLQGLYAQTVLPELKLKTDEMESILLLEEGKVYSRSSAVLRIARKLGGGWALLYVFIVVPKSIRDWLYMLIAKNRYKYWGKLETCWVPTAELKEKFLA